MSYPGFQELTQNTFFINLDHRQDRLEHVLQQFKLVDISAERINAVKTAVGAIGCTLSHVKCIELAKSRNYDYVFICEDDITFTNPALLKQNMEQFFENDEILWDVLIIGGNNVPPFQQITDYCARVFYCQTTTGYIVKKEYYDTLIANFKESANMLIRFPERSREFALDIYWKKLQLRDFWYMITPPSVTQYESYSDIENRTVNYDSLMLDMEKKWFVERQQNVKKQSGFMQMQFS